MRLVFVCTGNVCRSPIAERMTSGGLDAWLLAGRDRVVVSSAGTHAVEGSAMHPASRTALAGRGVEGRGHVAQQLTRELAEAADLVITMTELQRDEVLAINPRGLRTTFSLLEATALLASLPPVTVPLADDGDSHSRSLVALLADARRGRRPAAGQDDVPDPMHTDAQRHVEIAALIEKHLGRILRALVQPEFAAELWAECHDPQLRAVPSSSSSAKSAA